MSFFLLTINNNIYYNNNNISFVSLIQEKCVLEIYEMKRDIVLKHIGINYPEITTVTWSNKDMSLWHNTATCTLKKVKINNSVWFSSRASAAGSTAAWRRRWRPRAAPGTAGCTGLSCLLLSFLIRPLVTGRFRIVSWSEINKKINILPLWSYFLIFLLPCRCRVQKRRLFFILFNEKNLNFSSMK